MQGVSALLTKFATSVVICSQEKVNAGIGLGVLAQETGYILDLKLPREKH